MKMILVIKNYGPLTNIELDLNRIIVLTGDNYSGKTTLLKTIQFVKNIYCRKLKSLEEYLKEMKKLGEVKHIGKKIDLEISHYEGDVLGVIGEALKEEVGYSLREDSLIEFLINGKSVIKIDYGKAILRKLGRKELNDYKGLDLPETHLFPIRQIDVANTIAVYSNDVVDLVVTTHSPYILTALNNLIYAGKLYTNENIDKADLEDIICPRFAIEPGIVSAYYVEDGELTNILNDESGLIVADKLDQASILLADEFESLLDLE